MYRIINEKNYSLYKLLTDYQICIPIIQREYIQGVDDKSRGIKGKRERMIDDILENLKLKGRLNLNIVYGIHESEIFYPVDGQQRLTMLYLLHWYLAIKSDEFEEFCKLKSFSYETRSSANEFFSFLRSLENKNKWIEIFNSIDQSKTKFLEEIKVKTWFKIQWFTDITVFSTINVLGDFIEKINTSKSKEYYNQLKNDNAVICFDFLSEHIEDAENTASTNYIRLNSRGKQLENFENVKAVLSMIEDGWINENDKKFVYQYDQKYIDIFYKECSEELDLEVKTKEINRKIITLLMNTYNLLHFIKFKENQLKDFNDYFSNIFTESKEGSNSEFWKEYFEFLNSLLNTAVYDNRVLDYVKIFWNKEYQNSDNNKSDMNKLVAYLRYIYYYYKNQEQYVNKTHLEKLKYILNNLKYDEWKQNRFHTMELLTEHSSKYKDVFEYFVQVMPEKIVEDLEINKYNCKINDIKVRIKEQSIKAKIINEIKGNPEKFVDIEVNYDFFECIEKKSDRRQIQYLLHISDMWKEGITLKRIEKLLQYMEVAKEFFCNNTRSLLWRKLFAIGTCWDEKEDKLLTSEDINKKTNHRYYKYIDSKNYKLIDSNNNTYYWKDEYYFIWDDMEEKNSDIYEVRERKKENIKRVYEIWKKHELSNETKRLEWLEQQFDKAYNNCWLKYAVDRDYEELLINAISYDEGSKIVYINVKYQNEYGEQQKKANFFGRVYLLDKKKEGWKANKYYSLIWDYDSKRVNSNIRECGIIFDSSNKIINQFGLQLLWNSCFEKYLSYERGGIKWYERYFFYYIHCIDFSEIENSLISIMGGEVEITEFVENNCYKKYKYNFNDSNEKSKVEKRVNDFLEEIKKYKNTKDIEDENWKEYSYNYNYQYIHKCGYRGFINSKIEKQKFTPVGQEQSLEFEILK